MNTEEQILYKEAVLGQDASAFWNSDLGKHIIGLSLAESEEALDNLRTIDPLDSNGIRELQCKIQIAEKCLIWMNNAILAGKQSLELLEEIKEGHDGR